MKSKEVEGCVTPLYFFYKKKQNTINRKKRDINRDIWVIVCRKRKK